ncbi:unnamed protein product [Ceratitis capitata]|uniref:(Mediterranean fruit fly) hypothetical protein n=1 Tax=Ceratitis capitata TaxID=7213 RepID=A0A811UYV8_CERCA|nr:unnamed protein product [Ceratitis capitata]
MGGLYLEDSKPSQLQVNLLVPGPSQYGTVTLLGHGVCRTKIEGSEQKHRKEGCKVTITKAPKASRNISR